MMRNTLLENYKTLTEIFTRRVCLICFATLKKNITSDSVKSIILEQNVYNHSETKQ